MHLYTERELLIQLTRSHSIRTEKIIPTAHKDEKTAPSDMVLWCNNGTTDYCPLVISMMTLVCIISIILIVYVCFHNTIECKPLRRIFKNIRKKFTKKRLDSTRLSYDRSVIHSTAMDLSSPINNSFFSHVTNYTHSLPNENGNVWFTDVSKSTRPPPTYEESQSHVQNIIKPIPINPLTAGYHIDLTQVDNDGFVEEPQPTVVFPSHRCLTLTSTSNSRYNLNRLADLSRQLLEENSIEASSFTRNGSISIIGSDEVPPSYDAIVGNIVSRTGDVLSQRNNYISNEYLI